MFVDTGLLLAGGAQSRRAGEHALDAADQLVRGPLFSGMFGAFTAADAFHDAVTASHATQVRGLQAHRDALSGLGGKAHVAAAGFTAMDDRNAADLRALRCNSAI